MTFASRLTAKLAWLTAPCPGCRALLRADPSLRVPATCRCGKRLQPRQIIGGVAWVELQGRGAA